MQAKQASAAVTGVDAMVAQRAGILAQIALAELHLEFTEVRAPFNGVVVALKTTIGQYASALKPVFTLLDDDHWYVVANFRETDLQNVRPGVPARITVMTNHGRTFEGVVDSVGTGVLPDGGSVIEGLYVCGNDQGGFYPHNYPSNFTGINAGRTATFARIAAKHALDVA